MRSPTLRLAATACLAVAAAAGAAAQAPVPAPLPPPPVAPVLPTTPPVADPCPPDPCPPAACAPACAPGHRGPALPRPLFSGISRPGSVCAPGAPQVRVVVDAPKVVFRTAPGCAPGCATPDAAASQTATGRPQAAAPQAMVTVPVQSFQMVPVMTYQAVPVTTFQTVPASAVGVTATANSFAVGAPAVGFAAQPFGFGVSAQAAGTSDAELRALRMLLQLTQQSGGTARAAAEAAPKADAQAQAECDFEKLLTRLGRLEEQVKTNTRAVVDHERRITALESKRGGAEVAPPAGGIPTPRPVPPAGLSPPQIPSATPQPIPPAVPRM